VVAGKREGREIERALPKARWSYMNERERKKFKLNNSWSSLGALPVMGAFPE